MGNEKILKIQNTPYIVTFLIWSVALYVVFLVGFDDFWQDFSSYFSELSAENGVFLAVAPLFAFILSGFVGAYD